MSEPLRPVDGSDREYPPGVPCWVDHESADPAAAIAFYTGLFGWDVADRLPPSAGARYAVATLDGMSVAALASAPGAGRPARWNTYVRVDDAGAAVATAAAAGGAVLATPEDAGPAGRAAALVDPSGAELRVWQPGTNRGAQLVNADGAWNWSNLRTPDRDGADRFYATVFGWQLATFDLGGTTAHMWSRPGYGDHLARREPGVRERQDEAGAPPGFADAIAWLEEVDAAAPAHWHVTFAVADAEATANRAVELGGVVLVPPYDAGPVQITELADPLGAVFTVNHFDPARLAAPD
jgi:predicted enzyme related to lactoylglutathione lyase